MALWMAVVSVEAKNRLVVAKAPNGVELKNDFEVRVRTAGDKWQSLDTYAFNVQKVANTKRTVEKVSVVKFEMEGEVEIEVTSRLTDIDSFKIRPVSRGVKVVKDGRTLRFSVNRPQYLSVEINGDCYHNLHIFADSIMEKPNTRKRDLIYFGPGLHDLKGDSLAVPSGKTVFIDQGAVIKGWLSVYKSENVKIMGHGIVMPGRHEGIMVRYSKNIVVDGPLTTQVPVGGSESVTVRNTKVMSWYGWGDGFNVFASNDVNYGNVFARTSDDCSTIYCTRKGYLGGCKNIKVNGAVYWADVAHPVMIGLHSETPENEDITNVLYNDIDILQHAEEQIDYQGCLGINDGDNVLVNNVTFQNIRIENISKGMLLNLRICFNKKYCTAPGRGIENVTFRNVSYNGQMPNLGIIVGYDECRKVKNIRFENFSINGKVITDDMPSKPKWYKTSDIANIFVGEHVENVTFSK